MALTETAMNVLEIVGALLALAIMGVASKALLRWLGTKADRAEYEYARRIIQALVAAAEQKAASGKLSKDLRLQWVLQELKVYFPDKETGEFDALIHSEVRELNQRDKGF